MQKGDDQIILATFIVAKPTNIYIEVDRQPVFK